MRNKEKIIGGIVMLIILLVFLIVGYINTQPKKLTEKDKEDMFVEVSTDNQKIKSSSRSNSISNSNSAAVKNNGDKITVEIKGAVHKPDVYILDSDSVVRDLINEAGGLTAKADISNINQAKLLINHECIKVYEVGEVQNEKKDVSTIGQTIQPKDIDTDGKININTASVEELDKLPGIGAQYAQRIVDYRESQGSFKTIEDIMKVDGIKTGVFNKIKEKITLN